MRSPALLPALLCALFACSNDSAPPPSQASQYIDGFDPGPVPDGYTRYVTPVIHDIQPGSEVLVVQWLTEPLDDPNDVVDVVGVQSRYGHHVLLFATPEHQPVGTTRVWVESDMANVKYIGGTGGDASSSQALPAGVYNRIPRNYALVANTHFINAGTSAIDGQAAMDVEYAPADPSHPLVTMLVNGTMNFQIPPHATKTLDVSCKAQKDVPFFRFFNHMHEYGTSAFTEIVHADGSREDLVRDDVWSPTETLHPKARNWPVDEPFVLHAGDTLHTHCAWNNTTDGALSFPTEMCLSTGYLVGSGALAICEDGKWPDAL